MSVLRRGRKKIELPDVQLNITALMDVLTVLIFFLAKSMSVSAVAFAPPEGVRLPGVVVDSKDEIKETVVVSLSAKALYIDNKVLMQLENGEFLRGDVAEDQRTLIPLKTLLDKETKKRLALYAGVTDPSLLPAGKIIIQADKELPFKALKYLLHTATLSGYGDYQFAVLAQEASAPRAPSSVPTDSKK